ncbi:MAG: zinc-binding dehydrogenase [Pseudomonadota bacterium]
MATTALPETMTALVLREAGFSPVSKAITRELADIDTHVELAEIPLPKLKPGQVLVRVKYASVNPSDTSFVQGVYGQARVKGVPPGFEGMGTIVAGEGLFARALIGRRVAFAVPPGGSGSWAEYAVTEARAAIPLMKGVRDEDGAALVVNPLTAAAMVADVPSRGAFIATAAASQLGKLMAGLAKDTNRKMIGIVRRDAPIEPLKALGAREVLNETDPGFDAALAQAIETHRPKVLLDAVAGEVASRVHTAMGQGARWVIYGRLAIDPPQILAPEQLIFAQKQIEGFWLSGWFQKSSLPRTLMTIRAVQQRFVRGAWTTEIGTVVALREAMTRLPQALSQPDVKTLISME